MKPRIKVVKDGPLIVQRVGVFKNSKGEKIPVKPPFSLCRCGASKNKPFCDGSHLRIGFSGEKSDDRRRPETEEYVGKDITIICDDSVCAYSEVCVKNLPNVFLRKEPWVDPDGASVKEIIRTIESCPSGALSYRLKGKSSLELEREPAIQILKDGPYRVLGGIELEDEMGSTPRRMDSYTLCRCGASKNKPFCDGSHSEAGFSDEKN